MHRPTPSFITFTGLDRVSILPQVMELSSRYPIEWGVLIDPDQTDKALFPTRREIAEIKRCGLRLSAHVCGSLAKNIAQGSDVDLDLSGFSRIQVNHGREGANASVVEYVAKFSAARGVRGALQCNGPFPTDPRVDWLYDVSFGEGVKPSSFPKLKTTVPFCGYSGGIGPDTVAELLENCFDVADANAFWIDMESGVRTEGLFDPAKCAAVCRAVYD